MSARRFALAVAAIALAGALLRLHGIHDPIFDHPGWRQGDTAAIARNFATLNANPLYPQTDYDGPPPNYVELELQIVPYLASLGYRIFGVHEVFGRLISLAFGTATIVLVGLFGRRLFRSELAGCAAAAVYAVLPGAWYYSHTFMPDTAMVFFTVAALDAALRWIVDDDGGWRGWWPAALLLALAFLAKSVAVTAIVPIAALALARFGLRGTLARPPVWALLAAAFLPLALYDRAVASHAEWHWASGITRLHVLPGLRAALTSPHAFAAKALAFAHALKLLATTMLGPGGVVLAVLGFCVPLRSRADALLWGWLGGGLLYAYVVVTVERVDYYLYLLLPLGALAAGRFAAFAYARWGDEPQRRTTLAVAGAIVLLLTAYGGWREIRPYYSWNRANFARAKALDATLAPGALIVMGHYDPSILYTIGRKGWEEDPHLWTPFDEQSAIRKGARYYVAVERKRLRTTNLELYCWLARFPLLATNAAWPVYLTDPARVLPGAEARWRAFRTRERAGAYRNWTHAAAATAEDPCR